MRFQFHPPVSQNSDSWVSFAAKTVRPERMYPVGQRHGTKRRDASRKGQKAKAPKRRNKLSDLGHVCAKPNPNWRLGEKGGLETRGSGTAQLKKQLVSTGEIRGRPNVIQSFPFMDETGEVDDILHLENDEEKEGAISMDDDDDDYDTEEEDDEETGEQWKETLRRERAHQAEDGHSDDDDDGYGVTKPAKGAPRRKPVPKAEAFVVTGGGGGPVLRRMQPRERDDPL